MDALLEVFHHEPSLCIVVCIQCTIAVPPKFIVTHLQQHHPRVPVAQRSAIAAAARELDALAWEPRDVRLPERRAQRIHGLAEHRNGLVCRSDGCMYTCTSKQGIVSHCKKQHGWVNEQKRGGDARKKALQPPNLMWDEGQPCQQVFRAAGWPAFIAVERKEEQDQMDDAYARFEAQRTRLEEEEAAAAAHDTIREGRRQLPNPWLQMTGWTAHLKGCRRAELMAARAPPDPPKPPARDELTADDKALQRVCTEARRVVRKAFRACRPEVVGRPALEMVERRESGAESNEKPFYSGHKASTVARYGEKMVAVLCYVWRTCDAPQPPRYTLTHLQEHHMRRMKVYSTTKTSGASGAIASRKLQKHFLGFWIQLLDHSLPDDEHQSALLSGIAVLGLRPDHLGKGWAQAHDFSPVLSALVTTSKALVVYRSYLERGRGEGPSVYELVKDKANRYMRLTGFQEFVSPMNRMLRLRTLAVTFARQRNASGMVSWDGDKLLVDQQSFTMLDLQSMMHGLLETVRTRLLAGVLLLNGHGAGSGSAALPELRLGELVDQPAEVAAGYSFLKHPDNPFGPWRDWLLRRVVEEPALRRRFGVEGGSWREKAVQAYMKSVRSFKEGLFALVHLSAGAPARGSEVTSILCENGEDGSSHRGIFIHNGLVAFVTTYHKGYNKSNRVKTIHRYVPSEVSELVVYYLALARPFIVDVQRVQCGVRGSTPFMWEPPPDRQVDSDDEGEEHSNGPSDGESDGLGDGEGSGDDGDEPRRPSAPRAPSANPDGYWGTDRVRRVLREYTLQFLGAALGTRLWRHSYPAIHRELGTDSTSRAMLDALYYDKELEVDDARARQSGHTLRTEESNYGRQLTDSPDETFLERNRFRRVSEEWHRLLRFPSAWKRVGTRHDEYEAVAAKNQELASRRWATLAEADLEASFRSFVQNPSAKLRSVQRDALEAICQRKLRILVVMATGAGKSLLFMLPAALIRGGYTVVVAPLNALRDDMLDRCERAGIPCAKWDGRRPPYWARVILTTPESAVSSSFSRFLDEKRAMRELDRIVIDECHLLLESSHTWRPDVLKLTRMTEKDTQVVYLTATLPPVQQPHFLQLAGLDERSLTVCRDPSTSRPNIRYATEAYDRPELASTLARLVSQKRTQYGPEAQIIVYCPSRDEARRLSKLLRCPAFTSDMGTEEQKASRVRAFVNGADKLCTATNMLGLGLDAPLTRVVIHVTMCPRLEQYVQESGRAGRSGEPSEAIVLVPHWRPKTGGLQPSLPQRLDEHARAFLTETACRRIAIDACMDGRTSRLSCEPGEATCDLCHNHQHAQKRAAAAASPDPEAVAARARVRQREEAMRLESTRLDMQRRAAAEQDASAMDRLETWLRFWKHVCAFCGEAPGEHQSRGTHRCARGRASTAVTLMCTLSKHIQWEPFASCPGCNVPQAICSRWVATDEQGAFRDCNDDSCQFKGVMMSTASVIIANYPRSFRAWVQNELAREGRKMEPYQLTLFAPFLGERIKLAQRDASRMARFLLRWGDGLVTTAPDAVSTHGEQP